MRLRKLRRVIHPLFPAPCGILHFFHARVHSCRYVEHHGVAWPAPQRAREMMLASDKYDPLCQNPQFRFDIKSDDSFSFRAEFGPAPAACRSAESLSVVEWTSGRSDSARRPFNSGTAPHNPGEQFVGARAAPGRRNRQAENASITPRRGPVDRANQCVPADHGIPISGVVLFR